MGNRSIATAFQGLRRRVKEACCRHEWSGTYFAPLTVAGEEGEEVGDAFAPALDGEPLYPRFGVSGGNLITGPTARVEEIVDDLADATTRLFQMYLGGGAVLRVRCRKCRKQILADCRSQTSSGVKT